MTLHILLATPAGVTIVGDRLVTQRAGTRVLDPRSNKVLVHYGPGGMTGICYAGDAYIGPYPTDEWLAMCLAGRRDRLPGDRIGLRVGVGFVDELDPDAVIERLTAQLSALPPSVDLELGGVGWRWTADEYVDAMPFGWAINRSSGDWRCDWSLGPKERNQMTGWAVGMQVLTSADFQAMQQEIERLFRPEAHGTDSWPSVEDALVELIRRAAMRGAPGIGSDCMSVTIYPPSEQAAYAHARYMPAAGYDRAKHGRLISYTPWVITPHAFVSPQEIAGPLVCIEHGPDGGWISMGRSGEPGVFSVCCEAPPGAERLFASVATQPRPPQP